MEYGGGALDFQAANPQKNLRQSAESADKKAPPLPRRRLKAAGSRFYSGRETNDGVRRWALDFQAANPKNNLRQSAESADKKEPSKIICDNLRNLRIKKPRRCRADG
jgi:hypothetical protein